MKTLILVLLSFSLTAQIKFQVKDYAALGLSFVSGVADGYNQVQRHHYYRMQEIHPNINDNFWGVDQWKNKWKLDDKGELIPNEKTGILQPLYVEKFPGSSTVFVSITDAHHLTREIDKITIISGSVLITIGEKKKWYDYALRAGLTILARQAGFYLIHDVIYK